MNRLLQSVRQKMRVHVSGVVWLMIFGAVFTVVGAIPVIDNLRFVARSESANGVVVDVVEYGDYYPVVRFFTADERRVEFEASESAGDPAYFRVGESVGVLYNPDNPKDARLDTWVSRWGAAAILPLLGLFIFLLSFAGVVQSRIGRRRLTPSGSYRSERFFPAPAAQTFLALNGVASKRFNVQRSIDSTMRITLEKSTRLFSWGENLSAHVVPSEGGAVVRVEAVSKTPGQLGETSRLRKHVDRLFGELTQVLGSEESGGN